MQNISKIEMFVDHELIDQMEHMSLKLHEPIRREKVITFDQPYEGKTSGYVTVFSYNGKIHMYYRGYTHHKNNEAEYAVTCLALSADGVHFERPDFSLVEFEGSRHNNIIYKDDEITHNFTPFIDVDGSVKAVGGHKKIDINKASLYGLQSDDGVHFKKIQEEPVLTDGMFDSQNVVLYDESLHKYRCYSRYFHNDHLTSPKEYEGIRSIQSAVSDDFLHWEKNIRNSYDTTVKEEFYTNATVKVKGTDQYLSFPKRYVKERERDFFNSGDTGVSDCVFMSSRDGCHWHRTFMEAYVRPGLDRKNWVNRNNMMALGIIETSDEEFSMYISENYRTDTAGIRRLSIRKYGFSSVHAGYGKGMMITKPFTFSGNRLDINYSTSAVGFVKVTLLDKNKNVLATSEEMYGDEIFEQVLFDSDVKKYNNIPVRLMFECKDSDLYALTFKEE
ncbi:MAG: hypothetical protein JXQ23_04560 [Clostridia bacterium]|nr:hypothetical protein [Clostridia bacterium]